MTATKYLIDGVEYAADSLSALKRMLKTKFGSDAAADAAIRRGTKLETPRSGGSGSGGRAPRQRSSTPDAPKTPDAPSRTRADATTEKPKLDPEDKVDPDDLSDLKNAADDAAKSDVFKKIPKNKQADALRNAAPGDAGKLMDGMSPDDAAAAVKKMDTDSAAKVMNNMDPNKASKVMDKLDPEDALRVGRKLEPDDFSGQVFKGMDNNKFQAMLKVGSDIDKVNMAKKAGKLNTNMLVAGGMGIFAAMMYYNENAKAAEAAEKVKNCINKCLPKNWSDYEYGNLEVSDLQYTTLDELKVDEPNATAKTHPTCNSTIADKCPTFCNDKCNEEYAYKPPGSALPGAMYNLGVDALGDLYNDTLGGVFGNLGKVGKQIFFWGMILGVIILLIFIIRMFSKKKSD